MVAFVRARNWQRFHKPKNLAMSMAIEAAELMEHFQWLTHEQVQRAMKRKTLRRQVCDEMCDVLAFVLSLANALDVDLASNFERKMRRNERKYPVSTSRTKF
jgi:NTP pyrophosphatase (non-canonical NTP hydrolase)